MYFNERPTTEAEFSALLKTPAYRHADQQPVSVAAGQGIPYGEVTRLLDLLASHRLTKVFLETRHKGRR